MNLRCRATTDVGRKRERNEDSHLVDPELRLFIVADGMGGHAGGETASRLAVETIHRELVTLQEREPALFAGTGDLRGSPLPEALRAAVTSACGEIFHRAQVEPELAGMGTTVTALLLREGHAFIAHVGDSRAYLIRGGRLKQISEDHSLVHEQVKAGVITAEEAKTSRFRNIITRSVGFEEDVLVDVMGLEVESGDRFVLCSDGLTTMIEDDELKDAVAETAFDELPDVLVALANDRGGEDNVTVVCVEVT